MAIPDLPRNLRHLHLPASHQFTIACATHLPDYLQTLSMKHCSHHDGALQVVMDQRRLTIKAPSG